ncbi:unnamed protein product [Schistosoma guineensis]|nr:unnamed protein product [Schistosoma guineensis]
MLPVSIVGTILLLIISSQFITGFVVHDSGNTNQKPEESQFFLAPIATAIGTHLLTFLNGCFLDIGNLKKLIFPG